MEAFVEKPSRDELRPGEPFRINAGTYLLSRPSLERIPAGRACSIEREIFPLLAGGGRLFGFPSAAYWRDIGTPASYLAANHDVLSGAVVTESPVPGGRTSAPGRRGRPGAEVDALSSVGAGAGWGRRRPVGGQRRCGEEAPAATARALRSAAILGAGRAGRRGRRRAIGDRARWCGDARAASPPASAWTAGRGRAGRPADAVTADPVG